MDLVEYNIRFSQILPKLSRFSFFLVSFVTLPAILRS